MNAPAKAIVVPGTSTGIGRASVLRLLDAGFRVFAGVRTGRDAAVLRGAAPSDGATRLDTLNLDVTDETQTAAAFETVRHAVDLAPARPLGGRTAGALPALG
jgi:NAD(P)-dependent dehydrogenase (short-subunit alcohol dehydrogenase family)